MYGFHSRKERNVSQGGKIKGPGTGTSDSIKTEVPSGSYIMPADSTARIGEKELGRLGKPVRVNVSNGEYQMPPEQVHAVGVQALNQVRDATHTQVAAGFKPKRGELYFVGGGSPADDDARRRAMQGGPTGVAYGDVTNGGAPQTTTPSTPSAPTTLPNATPAPQPRARVTAQPSEPEAGASGFGSYLNRGDPARDAVNAIGGFFSRSAAAARTADPYGFGGGNPNKLPDTPAPAQQQTVTPAPSRQPAAEAVTPSAPPAPAAAQSSQTAGDRLSGMGFTSRNVAGAPGVQRLTGQDGRTIYTNDAAGTADWVQGGMRPGVSSIDTSGAIDRMARANAIRQGYLDAQAGSDGGPRGGVIGNSAVDETNARFRESALQESMKGMGRTRLNATVSMRNADVANQRATEELAVREREGAANRRLAAQAEANRTAIDRWRLGIDQQRADTEANVRGFEARGLERVEKLYTAYENAKTPEERAAVAEQIRAMNGKDREMNAQVIYSEELINPAQPMAGTRRVPMLLNRDGTATVVTPRATQDAPDGMRYVGTSNGKPVYEDQNGRRFLQEGN